MRWTRLLALLFGLVILAVWTPLLVAGIGSLRFRGRLGHSDALIVTGPYAYVRHPLYAGLSLTVVGLGVILGSWCLLLGGIGWALVTRFWSIHEERELAERFGPDYEAYRHTTPAIIPDASRFKRLLRGRT